jgi:hypothetical protein
MGTPIFIKTQIFTFFNEGYFVSSSMTHITFCTTIFTLKIEKQWTVKVNNIQKMETLKVQTINFSPKKHIQPQKDLTKI